MKYLIETKHGKDPATLTRAMNYEDASELYEQLTGYEAPLRLPQGETERYGRTILREATIDEQATIDRDGTRNLDSIIEDFSSERKDIAYKRAVREMEYEPDDEDDDDFQECYHRYLIMIALGDLLKHYIDVGRVQRAGIDSKGNVVYEPTNPNEQMIDII